MISSARLYPLGIQEAAKVYDTPPEDSLSIHMLTNLTSGSVGYA
jgi:hypothetical protein